MMEDEEGETNRDLIAAELFEAISHPTRIQILKRIPKYWFLAPPRLTL